MLPFLSKRQLYQLENSSYDKSLRFNDYLFFEFIMVTIILPAQQCRL